MTEKRAPYMKRLDERGGFWGITQDGWAEVNFIETAAHQVRGNHYHKETRELFFIIAGEIDIVIENLVSGECSEMSVSKGDVFVIEPFEVHTFHTRTDSQWINMLSQPVDPSKPDFHQVAENLDAK